MPIYEFFCRDCRKKVSFLTRSFSPPSEPACSACGNTNLVRTISGFAIRKSLKTVWDESGEPSMFPKPDEYKDPRTIGRWTEKRFQDMGMEMPAEIQEKINAAREGELPDSLKDLKSASPDASYH